MVAWRYYCQLVGHQQGYTCQVTHSDKNVQTISPWKYCGSSSLLNELIKPQNREGKKADTETFWRALQCLVIIMQENAVSPLWLVFVLLESGDSGLGGVNKL